MICLCYEPSHTRFNLDSKTATRRAISLIYRRKAHRYAQMHGRRGSLPIYGMPPPHGSQYMAALTGIACLLTRWRTAGISKSGRAQCFHEGPSIFPRHLCGWEIRNVKQNAQVLRVLRNDTPWSPSEDPCPISLCVTRVRVGRHAFDFGPPPLARKMHVHCGFWNVANFRLSRLEFC